MSHPYYHSVSSAKKHGGEPSDYQAIHDWFDQFKAQIADFRHRLILHNSGGIFLCEQVFGVTFTRKSDGKKVATRLIAEQHVIEDFGFIPALANIVELMPKQGWMGKGARNLSRELEDYIKLVEAEEENANGVS